MISSYRSLDADRLAAEFAAATPWPHVVIDGFVSDEHQALADVFPDESWDGWTVQFRDRYQANKHTCEDLDVMPEPLRELVLELQGPGFLELLERITGIDALVPDPYLEGGGLHLTGAGGVLEPHTDFHVYPRLNLFRQVNILLYLNPSWEQEWGGSLELFADPKAEDSAKHVVPAFGRCVIFRTDDRSVHGFPIPIAEGHRRRSIALYYYTAVDREGYVGDKYTYWRRHGEHHGVNKARLKVHEALVAGQGFLAKAAKAARPPEPKPIETAPARKR